MEGIKLSSTLWVIWYAPGLRLLALAMRVSTVKGANPLAPVSRKGLKDFGKSVSNAFATAAVANGDPAVSLPAVAT